MTWRKVKVSEFLTERANRFSPDEANKLGLQRVGKIDFSGNIHLVADKSTRTGMILVKKGDLLISGINAEKGAIAIYNFDEDALATIHYSSYTYDARKINITFLKWFLKSPAFKGILNSNAGNGIKTEIKPKRFLALEIYLPKLEEQEKIVKHIQAIEGEIGDLQAFSNENISLASSLRQSILTEAVQGQLTAQWRKENPNQEHARELLKRIAAEKAQLIKEKKISKEKPLPAIKEEEVPYALPEGWVWCRLQDIVEVGTGSTPSKANPSFYAGNIPWYTSSATGDLFAKPPEKFISDLALKETNCKVFPAGSLIIAMYGQGKTRGQVSELVLPGATNQALAAMVFFESSAPAKNYIKYYFRKIYHEIRELAEGGAQPNLNVLKVKSTLLPVPPLPEQHAIVQKVNTLLAYCDELEQHVKQSKVDLDLLMQSVLSGIFGTDNQAIGSKPNKTNLSGNETLIPTDVVQTTYEGNTLNMELLEILQQQGGKIAAINLWKMSKYQKDIDAFYEALKKEVEQNKTIKESSEKGWLELVAP